MLLGIPARANTSWLASSLLLSIDIKPAARATAMPKIPPLPSEELRPDDPLVSNRRLPAWFDTSATTIWRWRKKGIIGEPDAIINGREYRHASTLAKVGKGAR